MKTLFFILIVFLALGASVQAQKKVEFCIVVNEEVHFPQYLKDVGAHIPGTTKLNYSGDGINWILTPVEKIQGDVGVTKSGIIFIKASLLFNYKEAAIEKVHFIGDPKWNEKKILTWEGDYFVYRPGK